MNEIDKKWIDAIRPFIGAGRPTQPVPVFKTPTGEVDAALTLKNIFAMFGIKPALERKSK